MDKTKQHLKFCASAQSPAKQEPKLTNIPCKILDTKCALSTPPKKRQREKKSKRNGEKNNGGKKEAQRKRNGKKNVFTTQNLRGEGKLGQTTQSAIKKLGVALLCPLEPSKWTKQSNT